MTLFDTMFVRRSVRQYSDTPLDTAALSEIHSYIEDLKQLPGQKARFEIVDRNKLKGGMAPYAILAFSDENDAAFVNIGYTLQGVDLWLQSNGYGSIWCGMASQKQKTSEYRILLGFGNTEVPFRKVESEFNRKKIADISNEDNIVARAARLAPSAVNFQPWKLTFESGKVIVKSDVHGVGRVLPGKLYLFDLGIVLKHIETALEHEDKAVTGFLLSGKGKAFAVEVSYR